MLVTRPAHQHDEFAAALEELGARAILAPAIEITAPDDPAPARKAVAELRDYAWLVFTSANGVRAFFDLFEDRACAARAIGATKIAAIGPGTAAALRAYGIDAALIPLTYVAEDLARAIVAASTPGDRLLIFRAQEARDVLARDLHAAGRCPVVVAAYKTVFAHDERFAEKVAASDILTFTSASTVRGFVENLGGRDAAVRAAKDKLVACIGPITAQEARAAGLRVDAIAREYTARGLLQALEQLA